MLNNRVARAVTLLLVGALLLAVPASAAAQSPTDDQYGTGAVGQAYSSGAGGGELPFTGFDAGLLALAGAALLGGGLLVRRLSRGES